MSQSAKFQEEICDQWNECENGEITYYRQHNGLNPTSFKTFAWGYTRATQNVLNKVLKLIDEYKNVYWDGNFGSISDDILKQILENAKIAMARKNTFLKVLKARSTGNRQKARKIIKNFHKEHQH